MKVAVAGYGERSDTLPPLTDAPVENMIAAPKTDTPIFVHELLPRLRELEYEAGFCPVVDS